MKNLKILIFLLFILVSCKSLKDAGKVLRNEKITTTDEFLVKKRNPLVIPPNFDKIPEPGSVSESKESEEDKIKKILKAPETEKTQKKPSSIEKYILNRIKK